MIQDASPSDKSEGRRIALKMQIVAHIAFIIKAENTVHLGLPTSSAISCPLPCSHLDLKSRIGCTRKVRLDYYRSRCSLRSCRTPSCSQYVFECCRFQLHSAWILGPTAHSSSTAICHAFIGGHFTSLIGS